MPRYTKLATVNQTGRRKIKLKDFSIDVDYDKSPPEIKSESLILNLPEGVHDDSILIIDAFHKDTYQEFHLGTAANFELPEDLAIDQIGHNNVRFQLRVVSPDPTVPGMLSWRSAEISRSPLKEKKHKTSESTFQLLQVEGVSLAKGVPTEIDFPSHGNLQRSVIIKVNIDEGYLLHRHMEEPDPQVLALVIPPCIHAIVERLAHDASNETFDPVAAVTADSQWQEMWNALLKGWTTKGVQDIDLTDGEEVSDWASKAVSHWATMSGNPAKSANRMLGGY